MAVDPLRRAEEAYQELETIPGAPAEVPFWIADGDRAAGRVRASLQQLDDLGRI